MMGTAHSLNYLFMGVNLVARNRQRQRGTLPQTRLPRQKLSCHAQQIISDMRMPIM